MNETEKIQILLSQQNARHEDIRAMRERVVRLVSTAIALFLLFDGWVIQNKSNLSWVQTTSLILAIIVFWIGNLFILNDIRKGFITSRNTLTRIEQCLGLYQAGIFHEDGGSLLPEKWLGETKGKHIRKFEFMLSFAAVLSIVMVSLEFFLIR